MCVDFAEVVIDGNARDLGWVHVMCAFCCRLFRVLRRVGCAWLHRFSSSVLQLEKRKTLVSLGMVVVLAEFFVFSATLCGRLGTFKRKEVMVLAIT